MGKKLKIKDKYSIETSNNDENSKRTVANDGIKIDKKSEKVKKKNKDKRLDNVMKEIILEGIQETTIADNHGFSTGEGKKKKKKAHASALENVVPEEICGSKKKKKQKTFKPELLEENNTPTSGDNVDNLLEPVEEPASKKKKDKIKQVCVENTVKTAEVGVTETKKEKKKKKKEKQLQKLQNQLIADKANKMDQNNVQTKADKKPKKKTKKHKKIDENLDKIMKDDNKNKKILEKDLSKIRKPDEKAEEEDVKEPKVHEKEYSIFVGNLPPLTNKKQLTELFQKFGTIKTLRFRTEDGAVIFKKKEQKKMKSISAYVRFTNQEQCEKALEVNGATFEEHRLRVTLADKKPKGHNQSTIFIGNLSYKTTDNELYEYFSKVGDIEYVRQLANKGIAYVCFKKGVAIAKALKLNQQLLNNRPLRIQKIDPNLHPQLKKNKKGNFVRKLKTIDGQNSKSATSPKKHNKQHKKEKESSIFHGVASDDKKKKKKGKYGKEARNKKMVASKLKFAGAGNKGAFKKFKA